MPEDSGTTIFQGIQQSDKEWKRQKEKKNLFLSLLRISLIKQMEEKCLVIKSIVLFKKKVDFSAH